MHGGDDGDDVAVTNDRNRGRPFRDGPAPFRVRRDYFLTPVIVTVAALLGADVFPAASNATTEYVLGTPVGTAESVQLVAVVVAVTTAFRSTRYPVTPTLSVAGRHETATCLRLTAAANAVGAAGGTVSPAATV